MRDFILDSRCPPVCPFCIETPKCPPSSQLLPSGDPAPSCALYCEVMICESKIESVLFNRLILKNRYSSKKKQINKNESNFSDVIVYFFTLLIRLPRA